MKRQTWQPITIALLAVMDVTLDAQGENFDTWSAHPEVG